MLFHRIKDIHMMGIGGTGMSGIAEILLHNEFRVTGCDSHEQEILNHLRDIGASIVIGHSPEHVYNCDVVVYSSAIPVDHPELVAARNENIPTIKRAEMLGELSRLSFTIAVSGTHGKTTTTSLISFLADALGLDPTVIVGGRLTSLPGHARIGSGPYIIEADEFDRSLKAIHPTLAVMTNIDRDHMDCYRDFADICETFLTYLQDVPFFGKVVLNIDDQVQATFLSKINRPIITYGKSEAADFRIKKITGGADGTLFCCDIHPAARELEIMMPLFGEHNVYNATAALAALWDFTESYDDLVKAAEKIQDFPGISRRFEQIGSFRGIDIISDYAHHPREIDAVVDAAVQAYPDREVIAVFQPHLYSRTRLFTHEFALALTPLARVIVLPVYPAREEPIAGVTGESIIHILRQNGHMNARFLPDINTALEEIGKDAVKESVLLVLGAGSIHHYTVRYLEESDEA